MQRLQLKLNEDESSSKTKSKSQHLFIGQSVTKPSTECICAINRF